MHANTDTHELIQRFTQELQVMTLQQERWSLELDTAILWCLIASLQIALRHPHNTGPVAQITRQILDELIDMLPAGSAMHQVAQAGNDPGQDLPMRWPPSG